MNVRIGIAQSSQVIEITLAEDTDRDAIRKQVDKMIGTDDGVLWLTDRKGKELAVPVERISFIELGPAEATQRIGFGA
jgi:hypothetical protein